MNRSLYVRGTMVEDGQIRDLVIVDGVVADATQMPSREPDVTGWVLPGLVDVHNHLSLASPAGDHEEPAIRVRASASVELAVGMLAIREPGPMRAAARERTITYTGGRTLLLSPRDGAGGH
jgi:imidazolonepropionase-like amidohydrolase